MPTLPELATQLSLVVTTSATVAAMLTAGVIVVIKDWRISLLALVLQYVIVGLLLMSEIRMELALIKTLVGVILCLVLYMTARHVDWGRPASLPAPRRERDERPRRERDERPRRERDERPPTADKVTDAAEQAPTPVPVRGLLPTEHPFRFLAAALVMVAAYSGASAYPLPDVGQAISLAAYTLAALGLLAMGLTDEPLKAGLGLLTFVSAFELFYTVLEPSLIVVGLLGLANLLMGLAIAYLTVARATPVNATRV